MRLNDELALFSNLLGHIYLFFRRLGGLLLDDFFRDQVASDRVLSKLRIHLNLLILAKDRLIDFLKQDFDLGITEFHHSGAELIHRYRRLPNYVVTGYLFLIIEQIEDGSLKHICDQLVPLGRIGHYELHRSVLVQPSESLVRALILEPEVEPCTACCDRSGKVARRLLHSWPSAICQHFAVKSDFLHVDVSLITIGHKLGEYLSRQANVFEHGRHLSDLVGATFHLELLDKDLLILPRERTLIQEAGPKVPHILLQEEISCVQTAEQIDNLVHSFGHFKVAS